MEKSLVFKLLGSPQISLAGEPITRFVSRKAKALLIYIAVTGKLHSREMLAELFWQDMPASNAMKNLRTILPNLRQLAGSHLLINRQTISFNRECSYSLDVDAIQKIENRSRMTDFQLLSETVMRYSGDFLEGFCVPDAPEFENWVLIERERLRELVIEGLHALAEQHLAQKNYADGLAVTHKLLKLDPWRETAHQQQMFFLACTGQRRAALMQYESCCQMLADEFSVAPMPETTALEAQIRAGYTFHPDGTQREGFNKVSEPFSLSLTPQLPTVYCDWGEAVDVSNFYNREIELATLQQYILQDRCRLILLLGLGGIGKTALVTKLAQTVQSDFEYVIWRSLRHAPPLETLLAELVPFLSSQQDSRAEIGRLIYWLRSRRCLVILDNVETLFQEGRCAGQYRAGYAAYEDLFQVIGEAQHQSCILLTSRQKLAEVATLEGEQAVQVFSVQGSAKTVQTLIEARGLIGSSVQKQQLAERYGCNPSAIKIAAGSIQDMFEGDIEKFLNQEVVLCKGIWRLLEQQFERLSALEQRIMYRLAIHRDWIPITELTEDSLPTISRTQVVEAIESLIWRNLIEQQQGCYTQQPVVMAYVSDRLIEKIVDEIAHQSIDLLDQISLLKRTAKAYVRDTQQQFMLAKVFTRLRSRFKTSEQLEVQLKVMQQQLKGRPDPPLYAADNLIYLFCYLHCYLHVDLTRYDFSQLSSRYACLQRQYLQSVNFQDSQFHTTATQTLVTSDRVSASRLSDVNC